MTDDSSKMWLRLAYGPLIKELTELREIAQAVANGEAVWYDAVGKHCGFCDVVMDEAHANGCPVTKARAILNK